MWVGRVIATFITGREPPLDVSRPLLFLGPGQADSANAAWAAANRAIGTR